MKTKFFFLAALVGMALAGCSSDDFIAGAPPADDSQGMVPISFSSLSKGMTRADLYGSAAAGKLGNTFVVYGTKHTAAEDKTATNDAVVFNNFQVAWKASTAGTTASNSSDWDYVGLKAYDATTSSQGIKYWDYNAAEGYTFYAFSSSDISYPAASSDKVSVTKTKVDATSLYNKGYAVTVKNGATLNNLYFSDRVPVAKENYDKTVDLTFRNIGAKVRVGFYETIPGYSVKIDKFYIDDDATGVVTTFPAMNVAKTDGFYASLQNVNSTVDQTMNVTYYDDADETIENRPKITNPTPGYIYSLKLGNGTGIIGKTLGTTAAQPTWVAGKTADNYYIPVFPNEANNNPLLLKLDFTMTADDGSGDEIIKVRGARAIVPKQFVQWKSNFAYTYIFKISDKSNGTTGEVDGNGDPTDPEGLKPITFDAIVVDVADERQETITSVSTRSITTYAEGAIVDEYKASKPIYTVISTKSTGGVITPSAIGAAAGNAQVYSLEEPATEAEVLGQLTGSPMGINMTAVSDAKIKDNIPLVDGTNPAIKNVMFTPTAAGTYAYVYTETAYVAPTYAKAAKGAYDSGETYYMKSANNAYYAVSVPTEAAYEDNLAKLYTQSDAGMPGEYDVKIIKVQN